MGIYTQVLQLPVGLGVGLWGIAYDLYCERRVWGCKYCVHVGRCGAASELEPRNDARIGDAGGVPSATTVITKERHNEVIENVLNTY